MTIKSVNIIVPLKNEEKGIKYLIEKLIPSIKKIDKKINITLIDDHSTDQTWNIIKQYEQQIDCVKGIQNKNLTGFGNALKFGIENNNDDALIIFMGDCSDDPEDIEKYAVNNSEPEGNLLTDLTETTYKRSDAAVMISGPSVGNFLSMLIFVTQSKRVLEIGT